MIPKSLISVADLTIEEVQNILDTASHLKVNTTSSALKGKKVALIFEKPSLRTKVSFAFAIKELGGHYVYLSGEEVGLGTREPAGDIANVLSNWVDLIVARVFSHSNLLSLAKYASVPIINALSDIEHPCQAIADMMTIFEKKKQFKGLTLAFIGDGNNVASSLLLASASLGVNFVIACPDGYMIPKSIWDEGLRRASKTGSQLWKTKSPEKAVNGADIVYTDVWVSMGQANEAINRLKDFKGYQVNERLMNLANSNAIFMHDMPAHRGEEISENMLEDPRSVVFDQANNRLHAQKSILAYLIEKSPK